MPVYLVTQLVTGRMQRAVQLVNDFASGPMQTTLFKVCTMTHRTKLIKVQVKSMEGLAYPTADPDFTNSLMLTVLFKETTLTRFVATACPNPGVMRPPLSTSRFLKTKE